VEIRGRVRLKDFQADCCWDWDKEETKAKTAELQKEIGELQQLLYANGKHSVLLLFQGMDASGKDGSVRCVLQEVNPAGVETANFKKPSSEELAHDFLWRIHKAVPRYGNFGVFNRSHYEAVLVERVLNLTPREVWSKRYSQIVDFERMLAANNVLLLKFFLHISKEEQGERFRERLQNPHKNWKFSHLDLEMRGHWSDYMRAYEDVLNKTSHAAARWHLIPANHKWVRNRLIARAVVKALKGLKLKWPKPTEDLSKIKVT
jgi:PPK2 family polyphosphate:nucleotide phosphotransferase